MAGEPVQRAIAIAMIYVGEFGTRIPGHPVTRSPHRRGSAPARRLCPHKGHPLSEKVTVSSLLGPALHGGWTPAPSRKLGCSLKLSRNGTN